MREILHSVLALSLLLSPVLNAKPFGSGVALPAAPPDPAWIQGDTVVTTLGAARINAGATPDVLGLSHAEDEVFWVDLSPATPVYHQATDEVRGPAALCAIDANDDGDLDLVVSSRWNRKLLLFINQSDGSFGAGSTIATIVDTAVALKVADLDGDTRDDLVGITDFTREVFWMKHNANGSFGSPQILATTTGAPTQLEVADFNNDGAPDLAVLDSGLGAVRIFDNDGTASFIQIAQLGTGLTSFTAADFGNGVRPDIIGISSTLGVCQAYPNDDAGGFDPPVSLATGLPGHEIATLGDLDGDGDLDLLLSRYNTSQLLWMQNRGAFAFDAPTEAAASPSGPTLSLLTDTNGDSAPELIQTSLLGQGLTQYAGLADDPYAFWLDDFGLDAGEHPPGGDANGNGSANLKAYAFNFSPVASGSIPRLVLESGTSGLPAGVFDDPPSLLGIEFVRRTAANSGLAYTVQSSEDLATWLAADLAPATVTPIDADWERVRYLLPAPYSQRAFVRLKVDYGE